jgi:23S rRNA-/tRNA-specific pseudouridylate synthase
MVHDDYLYDLKKPMPLGEYYKYLLGDHYAEYHNLRIKLGLISINLENATSTEQIVQQGDYISSLIHYHERPVLDQKIEIIYEDDDMLVVNKPASIVVYPISGYRLNSLTFILAKEMGYMNIRPVHRLDRLTSGVIIFAKVNLL